MRVCSWASLMSVAATAALILLAIQPCAASAPSPIPTDLGILPGYQGSMPRSLNASGQVVGVCGFYPSIANPDEHSVQPEMVPFIWSGGAMSPLPIPRKFDAATAMDINASGKVVGSCWRWSWYGPDWEDYGWEQTDIQACMWQRGPNGWSVTLLGAPATKTGSEALQINDAGRIYARTWSTIDWAEGSAVLDNGVWTELKDSFGDLVPMETPWLWEPTLRRARMNQKGQVLAWSNLGGGVVLWDGVPTVIVPHTYIGSITLDNVGRVAGMFGPDGGDPYTAFLYQPDAVPQMQTLGCTSEGSYYPDFWLSTISDSGQILYTKQAGGGTDVMVGGLTLNGPESFVLHVPAYLRTDTPPLINASGDFCGLDNVSAPSWYANLNSGSLLWLNDLTGSNQSMVVAMNDSGAIAGMSPAEDGTMHAVLWGEVSVLSVSINGVTAATPKNPSVTVTVTVTNSGSTTANDVRINEASLGEQSTKTTLPLLLGSIKSGASKQCKLQFQAPPSGSPILEVRGTTSLGVFFTEQPVTVK